MDKHDDNQGTANGNDCGLPFPIGSYENAVAMIGMKSAVNEADLEVNAAMAKYFAGVVEDGNASYWDEAFAKQQWGALIAPPAMLQSWLIPQRWTPAGPGELKSIATKVPLPGDKPINVATDASFFEPVRVGDRLTQQDELVSVSGARTTRLGTGHFLVMKSAYHNQRGELVATIVNTLYRYTSPEQQHG